MTPTVPVAGAWRFPAPEPGLPVRIQTIIVILGPDSCSRIGTFNCARQRKRDDVQHQMVACEFEASGLFHDTSDTFFDHCDLPCFMTSILVGQFYFAPAHERAAIGVIVRSHSTAFTLPTRKWPGSLQCEFAASLGRIRTSATMAPQSAVLMTFRVLAEGRVNRVNFMGPCSRLALVLASTPLRSRRHPCLVPLWLCLAPDLNSQSLQ